MARISGRRSQCHSHMFDVRVAKALQVSSTIEPSKTVFHKITHIIAN
ncbi:Protein of unknown function, partial [Gryllus bimaculatus]